MNDTNPTELAEAIKVYREREGDINKTFNMFKLDSIITELREAKKVKTKGNK